MENETEQVHKRRVRYKGKNPTKFEEKYKEHQPEKYQEDIEKIIQKGKTPAGMHIPICVKEILDFLQIQPGQTGMDATLGYGGHTQKMLEALQGQGHLYATDIDPIESEKTRIRLQELSYGPEILTIERKNFAEIDKVAERCKRERLSAKPEEGAFDFVLADLGVSSMQIDNPERGFSFKVDGPLDLRLDPTAGSSAAERLRELSKEEIIGMLVENSDEPYAEKIAKGIRNVFAKGGVIETTRQLADVIETALSFLPQAERKEAVKKSCQRTFQALRIDVNSEFEVLYTFMDKLPSVLKSGGRAAILTFHSGEDRIVKKAMKQGLKEGIYREICEDVIRPSAEECFQNPRAHSTKMRWAIKA